jgi:plastocyanin
VHTHAPRVDWLATAGTFALWAVFPVILVAIVFSALAGDAQAQGSSAATALATATATPRTAVVGPNRVAATATVTIVNSISGFAPATLTVAVGDTVTWTNQDFTTHTVTGFPELSSGFMGPSATYQHAFGTVGTFDYHCEIHPNMLGRVVVQGPPGLSGSMILEGRPAPPNTAQAVPLVVSYFPSGNLTPVATVQTTSNANGSFTAGPPPSNGSFDVEVKSAINLSARAANLSFSGGSAQKGFGLLKAADANNDNKVSAADFTDLKSTFTQPTTCATAPTAVVPCADFDANGTVGPNDFSLLKQNFSLNGPTIIS